MCDTRDERDPHQEFTEAWASTPELEQLLAYMLAMPTADHQAAVAAHLPGGHLCRAHQVALLRASSRLDFQKQKWRTSVSKNKGVAYHTWLYHFLGGSQAKLLPPPTLSVPSETRWSTNLRALALRAEVEYKREVERLRHRGEDGLQQLQALRCALVDSSILRPRDRAASGGDPLPPAGSAAAAPKPPSGIFSWLRPR